MGRKMEKDKGIGDREMGGWEHEGMGRN